VSLEEKMFFQSETGPIYYEIVGKDTRPAVVFTHGAGLDHGMFDAQVEALMGKYRIIR